MPMIAEGLYLFGVCWLLAQLEIQIEGGHGWAEKLPTWKMDDAWILRLHNGRPLTGYHFYFITFLLAIFHLPILFTGFSLPVEVRILSYFFLTAVFWDFQWFVWNPAWGVRRFRGEPVWWFPKKILGFPLEYFTGIAASLLIPLIFWPAFVAQWCALFLILLTASAASVAAAEWSGWRPKGALR